ncbi:MAG TPA: sulfatase [Paenibacillus sp.]|nr:sulfatase [Paenibacillus sp.]
MKRPNVIWIFGDQHRGQAMSNAGDPNVHTPNMDILAATGVNFTRAVSGTPLCCPYRGALLSGRYPHHNGVPGHEYRLPPEQPTVAHAFDAHGYDTAYFGKWHLDGFREGEGRRAGKHIVPPERRGGFRRWVGYENNNSPWDCWVHGGEGDDSFQYRLPGFETDELTNLLIAYLREKAEARASGGDDAPFFAVLSVQPPHDPYAAPEPFMGRHNPAAIRLRPNVPAVPRVESRARRELAGYYAMIENLDWNIGRLRDALAQTGLAEDTHLVFFSDHGDMHGSHGQFRKTTPYEESIRVPVILSGAQPYYEGYKNGFWSDVPINHVDLAPTSLGLCGIEPPAWMEGTDYSGYRLEGRPKREEPDSAFLQSVEPTGHHNSVDRAWRGVVTKDNWKYVCFEGAPWLLFNLNEDPYEQANLAHNSLFAGERRRLHGMLQAWIDRTGDSFALPAI